MKRFSFTLAKYILIFHGNGQFGRFDSLSGHYHPKLAGPFCILHHLIRNKYTPNVERRSVNSSWNCSFARGQTAKIILTFLINTESMWTMSYDWFIHFVHSSWSDRQTQRSREEEKRLLTHISWALGYISRLLRVQNILLCFSSYAVMPNVCTIVLANMV